jgi:hypothetical protein
VERVRDREGNKSGEGRKGRRRGKGELNIQLLPFATSSMQKRVREKRTTRGRKKRGSVGFISN